MTRKANKQHSRYRGLYTGSKYVVKWGKGSHNESEHKTLESAEKKGKKQKRKTGQPVIIFYPSGRTRYMKVL